MQSPCGAKAVYLPLGKNAVDKTNVKEMIPLLAHQKRKKLLVFVVFKELKEKHGNKFDTRRLRLWARMVSHDDLENPPAIPAFCSTPQRLRQQSLATVISSPSALTTICASVSSLHRESTDSLIHVLDLREVQG